MKNFHDAKRGIIKSTAMTTIQQNQMTITYIDKALLGGHDILIAHAEHDHNPELEIIPFREAFTTSDDDLFTPKTTNYTDYPSINHTQTEDN